MAPGNMVFAMLASAFSTLAREKPWSSSDCSPRTAGSELYGLEGGGTYAIHITYMQVNYMQVNYMQVIWMEVLHLSMSA